MTKKNDFLGRLSGTTIATVAAIMAGIASAFILGKTNINEIANFPIGVASALATFAATGAPLSNKLANKFIEKGNDATYNSTLNDVEGLLAEKRKVLAVKKAMMDGAENNV